jgi:hypothetical protein
LQASCERKLADASKTVPMAIVGEVRDELRADKTRGGASFMRWLESSQIDVRDIQLGSAEAATLNQLTASASTSKNLGERASIALAAHDLGLVFVTHDKNGMWLAVRELWQSGQRVLGVAPFLRRLVELQAVTQSSVLDDVVRHVAGDSPTWWATWRASLSLA